MNTNHATGPWTAEKHPKGHYGIFQRDHAHQIAEVFDRNTPPERVTANAELIAAAPELLDALQSLWAFVEDAGKSNPGWMSKLCLQDYGAMNDAYMKTERVLAQISGQNASVMARPDGGPNT